MGKTVERPIILFIQDNTASLLVNKQVNFYKQNYPQKISEFIRTLSSDYDVKQYVFDDKLKQSNKIDFTGKSTDIANVFAEIDNLYINQNVGAIVLASDGIFNKGSNPLYIAEKSKIPVYTIALGDTIPQKDLRIKNVDYNQIVYFGNNFAINTQIASYGLKGAKTKLSVIHEKKVIINREIAIDKQDFFTQIPLTLSADKPGVQKYTIVLSPLMGEITEKNNTYTLLVEVLQDKQKILLLANAPHPDLSAIKAVIESNKNYEVKVAIIGQVSLDELKNYQLLVLHQLPSSDNTASDLLSRIRTQQLPVLYVIGNQTYIDFFNQINTGLSITSTRNSYNESLPVIQNDFYLFTLNEETKTTIQKFPPLSSPFGKYSLSGNFSTLLKQKIGALETDYPLLTFNNTGGAKSAFLCGEGIWKWRLHNYQTVQNHDALNELMGKTIQYLATRDDKRRFRVSLPATRFDEAEALIFNAELYNNSYELINDPEITLEIKNSDNKQYNFTFSKTSNAYILNPGSLPTGDYTYTAKTKLGKESFSANGRFSIAALNLETLQTTADHQLLYTLSSKTGGELFYVNQTEKLLDLLKKREDIKSVSYEEKKVEELIHLKWLCLALILFVSFEWIARKRNGAY